MYEYIKGKITGLSTDYAVVEAGGIGYRLFASGNTVAALSMRVDKETLVYTYLNVREDVMELYGFYTEDERRCFTKLLAVSGIGPKAAMSVLTAFTPQSLANAVAAGDAKEISRSNGIGLKTAQKIIIEMKGKLDFGADTSPAANAPANNVSDAVNALTLLGYTRQEASKAVDGVDKSLPLEEIISAALSRLNRF